MTFQHFGVPRFQMRKSLGARQIHQQFVKDYYEKK